MSQPTKTPHEITCDLLMAAKSVLGNPGSVPTHASLEMLSNAVCAFEETFVVGGSL